MPPPTLFLNWWKTTHRRLKNVVMLLDWTPNADTAPPTAPRPTPPAPLPPQPDSLNVLPASTPPRERLPASTPSQQRFPVSPPPRERLPASTPSLERPYADPLHASPPAKPLSPPGASEPRPLPAEQEAQVNDKFTPTQTYPGLTRRRLGLGG